LITNICLYSEGRLPACFARGFGLQVGPFVILCDPNQNEIEVAVEKRNGKVYFVDGWAVLKNFYRILAGSWITVILANRRLFLNSWDGVLFWVVIWVYLNFVMSWFFCSTYASQGPFCCVLLCFTSQFCCWCFVLISIKNFKLSRSQHGWVFAIFFLCILITKMDE